MVGDHLRVGERLWIVTSVEGDPVGTSVICERLRDVPVPEQELHHEWRRQGKATATFRRSQCRAVDCP